jgi:type IV pilus assembly protein PilO
MTLTRKWSLMAAVLVAAIFAASWFLLIAPKRSEAAQLRTETVSQEDANERLVQQLAVLKAQQADLPEQRATLEVLKTQVPDDPALPTLIRNLTSAGRKVGADITSLAPSPPTLLTGPAAAAVPTTTTTDTSTATTSDTTTGTTTDPAAAVPTPSAQLYQVPLSLTVQGSYFELEQFIERLEKLKRSFLTSGFTITVPEGEDIAPGTLEIALQGRVFLSPPVSAAPAVPTTPTTAGATAPAAQ